MSESEKSVLARSASDECRSCAGSAHDIMSERESTCLHDWRTAKLLSELAHDIMRECSRLYCTWRFFYEKSLICDIGGSSIY